MARDAPCTAGSNWICKAHSRFCPVCPCMPGTDCLRSQAAYAAWVRLSNGGTDRQSDPKSDVRGFAIEVSGVGGSGALGSGPGESQDFLPIDHPAFVFSGADEFVGLVRHLVKGSAAVLGYPVSRYGFFGAMGLIKRFAKTFNAPFSGFATEAFHSAALTVPPQDPQAEEGRALAALIEAAAFDPWSALTAHRSLGEVARARWCITRARPEGVSRVLADQD